MVLFLSTDPGLNSTINLSNYMPVDKRLKQYGIWIQCSQHMWTIESKSDSAAFKNSDFKFEFFLNLKFELKIITVCDRLQFTIILHMHNNNNNNNKINGLTCLLVETGNCTSFSAFLLLIFKNIKQDSFCFKFCKMA